MAAELTLQVSAVEGSVDAAANTSRVRIDLTITTTLGTWSHDYTTHGYIKLDGTQIVDLNGKWVDINTTTALYSGEHTVSHNVDGTKSVTVEAGFDMNTTYTGWSYATRELALPDIPRASGLEVGGITLGADNTLTIRAAAAAFTHTLSYTLGAASGTVCSGVSGGTVHWKPDISLCAQLPNSASGNGTLTLITYSGGNEIGRNSVSFTAYVPVSAVPVVTAVHVLPVNDNAVLRDWGVYVKGRSKISFSVTAQGAYGSAVTGGSFSCAGQTVAALSGTTGLVGAAGTFTPSATVKDSRQRTSASHSGSDITVYDYAVPTISASYARRSDASGAAQENGTYIAVQCTAACASVGGRNSVSLRVRTRYAGGSWSGYTQLQNGVQKVLSGFSAQRSYEVELSAEDALGERKTVVYAIPTETITFMLRDGGEGASFGKYPEYSGLDMGWDIHMNGNRVTGLPAPAADSDAVPWSWVSGFGLGSTSKMLTSKDDLNLIWRNGWYSWWTDIPKNAPTWAEGGAAMSACIMRVWTGNGGDTATSNTRFVQEVYCYTSGDYNAHFLLRREVFMDRDDGTVYVVRPWEWVNPLMSENVEYRTTERYNTKPVYVKLVNCGSGPANETKAIEHGVSNAMVIDFGGYMEYQGEMVSIPWHSYSNLCVNSGRIEIATTANYSLYTAYVWIKYYKTTD